MEQLLRNETKISHHEVGGEIFTITDKRIIYEQANASFISYTDIRGCSTSEESFKQNRLFVDEKILSGLLVAIAALGYLIYILSYFDGEDMMETFFFVTIFLAIGSGGAFFLYLFLRLIFGIVKAFFSYTVVRIVLTISGTDGSIWFQNNYDLSQKDKIHKLTNDINTLKFSN